MDKSRYISIHGLGYDPSSQPDRPVQAVEITSFSEVLWETVTFAGSYTTIGIWVFLHDISFDFTGNFLVWDIVDLETTLFVPGGHNFRMFPVSGERNWRAS